MIRKAVNKDLAGLIKLAKEAHEKSISNSVKLDVKLIRKNIQICILSAEHFVFVVEIDGEIEGAIIWSDSSVVVFKKQASNRFIFICY